MGNNTDEAADVMTLVEAIAYLGVSRATFYNRVRELGITPVPGNAALKNQKRTWRRADIERMRTAPPKRKPTTTTTTQP